MCLRVSGQPGSTGDTGATGGTGATGAQANKRRKRQAGCPGQSTGTIPPGVSRWIGISVAVGVRDIRTDRRLYQSMSFVAFISGCESRIVCAKAVKKLDLG